MNKKFPSLPFTLTVEEIKNGKMLTIKKARKNRKVLAEVILNNLNKFDMNHWFRNRIDLIVSIPEDKIINHCKTTMCLAGWTCALASNKEDLKDWSDNEIRFIYRDIAESLLNLPDSIKSGVFNETNEKTIKLLEKWKKYV